MSNLRLALEAALVENPDDLATHMAYADHLSEQGDPRGEFISVQLALEDPTRPPAERERLRQREAELLATHQRDWLGAAADLFLLSEDELANKDHTFGLEAYLGKEHHRFAFTRGWLTSLYLENFASPLAEALKTSPTIRLLRELTIRNVEYDDRGYEVLAQWPCLDSLRRFQLGPDDDQCHTTGEGVAPAIAGMKRLEELYLYAHNVDVRTVFSLPLPYLRTLYAYHLHDYPLEVLGANPSLGNLVTLACWPHCIEPWHDRGYIQPDSVAALVRSPHLKSLTHLALYLSDLGDEGVRAIVESGILRRLGVLDLWSGRITDAGARLLASCPDLRRLERLRIAQNQLTLAGVRALQETGVHVEAEGQLTAALIADNQHLVEGDVE